MSKEAQPEALQMAYANLKKNIVRSAYDVVAKWNVEASLVVSKEPLFPRDKFVGVSDVDALGRMSGGLAVEVVDGSLRAITCKSALQSAKSGTLNLRDIKSFDLNCLTVLATFLSML